MLSLRLRQWFFLYMLTLLFIVSAPTLTQASDYGTCDLTLDSRGSAVSQLQQDLASLGYYTYKVDGWFGAKTHDAVVRFQKSQGLKTDGLVGPITKAALNRVIAAAPSPTPASDDGTDDLALDSRGSAVSQLQQDLASLGYYTYKVDGWFGAKTHDAVVRFQKSQGLKTDGVVGPITKSALNQVLTKSVVSPKVSASAKSPTAASISQYNSQEKPIVDAFRANFDGSLAQTLVGRAIWYMEHGYMKYGHSKYPDTGYIDCSNFVSLVYKDFDYSITSAAKNYGSVGEKVAGVYSKKITGTSKYTLVGTEKLKPGDIFTFWNSDDPARTHIGHVAIYMGVINGKPCIINTCSGRPTAIGIINSFAYWYGSSLIEVRRVLPDSAYKAGNKINDQGPVLPKIYQIKPNKPIILPVNLPAGF
ncbi:MAG TPA: peptidoglycan-binding protein [Syntrophomonas sp.]|nr:peptidoglycan-binding protein [Syntrophomonas sp.]HRW12755.1 peptidoglycan-binding protein [Syntrophomonas sp.]